MFAWRITKAVNWKLVKLQIEVNRVFLISFRPGSDAVLHMSRIEFEFRPTQINLDLLN